MPPRYYILLAPHNHLWHVYDRRRGHIVAGFKSFRGARDYTRHLNIEQDKQPCTLPATTTPATSTATKP